MPSLTGPRLRTLIGAVGLFCLGIPSLPAQDGATVTSAVEDRFAIPATDDGLPGVGPIRRYEWFQKLWRERRSAWAGQVEQDQGAVVFLGDSITQGWGDGSWAPRSPG